MAIVADIVKLAMKDAGIIGAKETPADDEMQDAFVTLNEMLAVWRTESLSVYCQKQQTFNATGAQSYTVGTGGVVNIERPPIVDAMFWTYNGVDTPLKLIHSFEDYQDISLKTLNSQPSCFFYRADYPLAQLFVWPIPTNGTLTMTLMQPMPTYVSVNDDISLPPEYEAAVRFNLCVWLCSTFGVDAPPRIDRLASSTKKTLKRNNNNLKTMRMPAEVMRNSYFNINTGQGR